MGEPAWSGVLFQPLKLGLLGQWADGNIQEAVGVEGVRLRGKESWPPQMLAETPPGSVTPGQVVSSWFPCL